MSTSHSPPFFPSVKYLEEVYRKENAAIFRAIPENRATMCYQKALPETP